MKTIDRPSKSKSRAVLIDGIKVDILRSTPGGKIPIPKLQKAVQIVKSRRISADGPDARRK